MTAKDNSGPESNGKADGALSSAAGPGRWRPRVGHRRGRVVMLMQPFSLWIFGLLLHQVHPAPAPSVFVVVSHFRD